MGTNGDHGEKLKAGTSSSCDGCGNGAMVPGASCPVCTTPQQPAPPLQAEPPSPPPQGRQLRRHLRRSGTSASTSVATSQQSQAQPGPTRRQLFRDDGAQPSTSTGRRSTTCPVCFKTFASAGKLSQHGLVHTGERPYRCSACPKAFSSKFKLVRHALIHTDHRQYTCPVCERTFHRKDHLKNHAKVHSPVKWRYKCRRAGCDKEYSSALSLKKHEAGHAAEEGDLECKMCGQVFDTKEAILFHLKVHAGSRTVKTPADKKYRCDHCERRFFTGKDVRRHSVVHTGRRDFLCQFCPQRFGRKDHLVRHMKKSHLGQGNRHKKQQQQQSTGQQQQQRRPVGTIKQATAVIREMAAAGTKPAKLYPPPGGHPIAGPSFQEGIVQGGASSEVEVSEGAMVVVLGGCGGEGGVKEEMLPGVASAPPPSDFAEELSQFTLPSDDESFILATLLAPPPRPEPPSETLPLPGAEPSSDDDDDDPGDGRLPLRRQIPPLPTFKQAFPPPPKPPS